MNTLLSRGTIALLLAALALPVHARSVPHRRVPPAATAAAVYPSGAVSAADPRAAAAGAEMLRLGGNATDAALATMLALNVVEPQSSGIGGGGFLVHGDASGHVTTFDGREFAPAAAGARWWLDADGRPLAFAQAQPGGRSVGVPGAIRLAAMVHARFGHLAWARLFGPAIRLAEEGFAVSPRLANSLANAPTAGLDPAARALFFNADGAPVPAGTTVRNPALAAFFRKLAAEGPAAFYGGTNAAALVARVNGAPVNPSPLTAGDLAAYTARAREPLCGAYRQWRICGMGPPSSGETTVYAILKQLERFDLATLGPASPVSWHLIAESMRLAYADRDRYLGDPGFVSVPVRGLMDPAYLSARSALIDPAHTMAHAAAGTPPGAESLTRAGATSGDEHGTTHFVAVDRSGESVSYTNTVESAFGSGLMVNGYYLNNELTDFDFVPEKDGRAAANAVGPRKRPRSSMAPTLVYDRAGHLRIAIGAAGGATIPAQVAKALIGVLDWKLGARDAIALPVLFAPGDTVFVEQGSAQEAMIPALGALGHADVRARASSFKANAVEVVDGRLVGAADPRSEGAALTP